MECSIIIIIIIQPTTHTPHHQQQPQIRTLSIVDPNKSTTPTPQLVSTPRETFSVQPNSNKVHLSNSTPIYPILSMGPHLQHQTTPTPILTQVCVIFANITIPQSKKKITTTKSTITSIILKQQHKSNTPLTQTTHLNTFFDSISPTPHHHSHQQQHLRTPLSIVFWVCVSVRDLTGPTPVWLYYTFCLCNQTL